MSDELAKSEEPLIKVHIGGGDSEMLVNVEMMEDEDELDAYLQENGATPTEAERIAVIDDYCPTLSVDEITDLPEGMVEDLYAHISPDPESGRDRWKDESE